jgi:hypothetical protein
MKFFFSIGAVLLPFATLVRGVELNADDEGASEVNSWFELGVLIVC